MKDWQGIKEESHVERSEAAGGGKPPKPKDTGFEGRSEKNLAPSEADKGKGKK